MPVGETLGAKILFLELVVLDHGAHGTIENQNTFGGGIE
jgi:hypothetical protein